jgi:hypothetical protein
MHFFFLGYFKLLYFKLFLVILNSSTWVFFNVILSWIIFRLFYLKLLYLKLFFYSLLFIINININRKIIMNQHNIIIGLCNMN